MDGPNADELLAVEGEGAASTPTPPVVATILLLWLVLPRGSHPPVVLLLGDSPPVLSSPKAPLLLRAGDCGGCQRGEPLLTVHVLQPELHSNSTGSGTQKPETPHLRHTKHYFADTV